jgi:hypothetical protein
VIVKTNHWLKHGNFIEASMNGRLIGQSHETLTQKHYDSFKYYNLSKGNFKTKCYHESLVSFFKIVYTLNVLMQVSLCGIIKYIYMDWKMMFEMWLNMRNYKLLTLD